MIDETTVFNFTLDELGLVDAPPEDAFDNVTKLATSLLDAPVSLVSVVDFAKDRQFFKSQVGLTDHWARERQTPLSHSFCQHVVTQNRPLIVEDASKHDLVKDNLAIPNLGVAAYLGVPFYGPTGHPIGAMCVVSGEPRAWTQDDEEKMTMLAHCVTDLVRLRASLKTSEVLRQEQQEFASVLSHDMKSPTNTLKLLHNEIATALSPDMDDSVEELLSLCQGTTNRMSSLVEEVLSYTRVTNSTGNIERVDLNTVLNDVLVDLKSLIHATGANIDIGNLPAVDGNVVQLRVLLQNLVSNAIKFVNPSVVPNVAVVSLTDNEHHMTGFMVRDNGIGIEPDNQERIFRMFQRLHLREEYPGSGIGLALCQRIVRNHSGSIEVTSLPGEGSKFSIKLPVKDDE